MNRFQKLCALFKKPVEHIEFVFPGAILLSVSLLYMIMTLLYYKPLPVAINHEDFKAGLIGFVISIFILYRTKTGTVLFAGLPILYIYIFNSSYEWRSDDWSRISDGVISAIPMFLLVVTVTRKQIHYHKTRFIFNPFASQNQ